jgi:hypothetical protein
MAYLLIPLIGLVAIFAIFSTGQIGYSYTSDNPIGDDSTDEDSSDDSSQISITPSTLDTLVSVASEAFGELTMAYSAQIQLFAQAIAFAEGYGPAANLPTKANNPGDLSKGAYGDTGIYITAGDGEQVVKYASASDGFNALYRQLQDIVNGQSSYYNLGMTIQQMGATWASPPGLIWGTNVAAFLTQQGTPATAQTLLSEVLS